MSPHNRGSLIYVIGVIILATVLCIYAKCDYNYMKSQLPITEYATQSEVDILISKGELWVGVLGTGSMQPTIPSGRPDQIVAYVKLGRVDFSLIKKGDLIVFHRGAYYVMHQASALNKNGWIPDGSHNKVYDTDRITRENYVGIAVKILILKENHV